MTITSGYDRELSEAEMTKPAKRTALETFAAKGVPKMTDEEVTTLARDLVQNRVFMSDQIRRPEDFMMVFPVLAMLSDEQRENLRKDDIGAVYEYNDRALPRSVNGYPMFMSARMLSTVDYKRVRAEERRMRIALGEKLPEVSPNG